MTRLTRALSRLRLTNLIQSPALIFVPLLGALAIPAMSLLGSIASAAPQAGAADLLPAYPQTQSYNNAAMRRDAMQHPVLHVRPAAIWPQTYTVRRGDSLTSIAKKVYGKAADWPWIWKTNKSEFTADPVLIQVGWKLKLTQITGKIPAAPAIPEPKAPAPAPVLADQQPSAPQPSPAPQPPAAGILSAAQVGALWLQEGGSSAAEATAECIAMHESGGNPDAVSPTDDDGLFQEHGRPDVLGNAALSTQVAIQMSGNGTNWSPWTTAASCGV